MKCIFGEKKVGHLNPLPQVLAATNDEPTQDNSVDKDIETSLVSFPRFPFLSVLREKRGFFIFLFSFFCVGVKQKKEKGNLGAITNYLFLFLPPVSLSQTFSVYLTAGEEKQEQTLLKDLRHCQDDRDKEKCSERDLTIYEDQFDKRMQWIPLRRKL